MKHIFWSIGHELKLPAMDRARGLSVFDCNGNEYLDFESGVWCTPLGHSHPEVTEAALQQLGTIPHTGYCYAHPVIDRAARRILDIVGFVTGKCVFLCSGSEAVEFGVKAIQTLAPGKKLLTLADSFLSSYGSSGTRSRSEWLLLDWTACRTCACKDDCDPVCPVLADIPFDQAGGFVCEPGSASGLVRFPPKRLIAALCRNIRTHGGFIQVNEVTTGMGRTGRWFGFQHFGIEPDIVSLGKGLGNGYPVSAIALTGSTAAALASKGFTYSQSHQNDPLGAAVALKVIEVMKRDDLPGKAADQGHYLKQRLEALRICHPAIEEIRGRGLILSITFSDRFTDSDVHRIFESLLERHRIIIAKRTGQRVVRIDPPLIVTREQIDCFIRALDQTLTAAAG